MAVELKIRFALDGASLSRAMRGVNATMSGLGKNVMAPMGAALANTAKLGAVVAGAAAAMGGLAMRNAMNYADGVQKMSEKTGIGTEALSKLQHAAALADIEVSTLATAFKFSQVAVGEAASGTKTAQKTLSDLGLEYRKLRTMSPEKQFMAITGALSKVKGQSEKARLATEVYGRSGTEMLKLLAGGMDGLQQAMADADTLGLVVTPEQGKAAAAFNDAITRVKGSLTGLSLAFFEAGRFTDILDRITDAAVRMRNSAGFAEFAKSFSFAVGRVVQYAEALVTTWNGLSQGHRQSLQNMLVASGAFGFAWKLGFVTPIINGIGLVLFTTKAGFMAMAGALTALASFVIGLKIGRALEEAFNISGLMLRFAAAMRGAGELIIRDVKNLASAASTVFGAVGDKITGKISFSEMTAKFNQAWKDFSKNAAGDVDFVKAWGAERMAAIAEQDAAMGQLGKSFTERMEIFARRFKAEFSWDTIKAELADLIPESLRKFLDDLSFNLANLPEPPDFSLPKSNLEAAADASERIYASMVPLRGLLRQFGAFGLSGVGGLELPAMPKREMPRPPPIGAPEGLNLMDELTMPAVRLPSPEKRDANGWLPDADFVRKFPPVQPEMPRPPIITPAAAAGPLLGANAKDNAAVAKNTGKTNELLTGIAATLSRGSVISFAS